MQRPRKAIVLAAGYGTRMRPLTDTVPKPMLPLFGRPIIAHTIELLEGWGVRDILVNLHHLPGQLIDFLKTLDGPARIHFSFEPEILGTGGAIRKAEWFLDDKPFWIMNSDIAAEVSPTPLIRDFQKQRPLATLWLHPELPPRTVQMKNGSITDFASRSPGKPGTYTFCGLHLVSPAVLTYLPAAGPSSIIDAYRLASRKGKRITGVVVPDSFWADLGTPASYLDAHANLHGPDRERGIPLNVLEPLPVFAQSLKKLGWPAEHAAAAPMPTRGSDRSFTRLSSGRKSAVLVQYGTDRKENRKYAGHASFLAKRGIAVPQIIADMPAMRATVAQDLGDITLLSLAGRRSIDALYRPVLDQLLRLHAISPGKDVELEPAFTPKLYRWEHELMAEHLLKKYLTLKRPVINRILAELKTVADRLQKAPRVLLHRDMQSSNILMHGNRPYFIDFQGMRMGPAAYDLASLLCDPYVMLSAQAQHRLLKYYAARSPDPALESMFWHAAVQRLVQALGAFARMGDSPGTGRFADYIRPGLRMLKRAVQHTAELPQLLAITEGELK